MNLILNTDSYKASHFLQYPQKTEHVSSYIEARGVSKSFVSVDRMMFFGLQAFIKEYLERPITLEDIQEAKEIILAHGLPFNEEGWMYILNKHEGFLPIRIQAIPEGSLVPIGTPLVQVVNTDPKVPWLTSYLETALLRAVWYPTTVATLSWYVKQICRHYLEMTSSNMDHLEFMLHDFGARGVSSEESAALGGMAHMINFKGSDTLSGIMAARKYYGATMPAFSIPAAEHSTITSWGRENEKEAFRNMIDQFGTGMYAVVSDSYDIFAACEHLWGEELKDAVINAGGRLVIRPDSGDPLRVILRVLDILDEVFGSTYSNRGYKVLHPSIRIIQGDGVTPTSIEEILSTMEKRDWSAENIVFGMGGALLQKVNRDSLKFAMKASAICIDGEWHDVYKDPITDPGKISKRGIQAGDDLRVVYANGYDSNKYRFANTFDAIRTRANA